MLELNVVFFHCMISNYAYVHVLVQSIPIFIMCMFMGLVPRVDSSIGSVLFASRRVWDVTVILN